MGLIVWAGSGELVSTGDTDIGYAVTFDKTSADRVHSSGVMTQSFCGSNKTRPHCSCHMFYIATKLRSYTSSWFASVIGMTVRHVFSQARTKVRSHVTRRSGRSWIALSLFL